MAAKKPDRVLIVELREQVKALEGEMADRLKYMRDANLRLVARCERTEAILAGTLVAKLTVAE